MEYRGKQTGMGRGGYGTGDKGHPESLEIETCSHPVSLVTEQNHRNLRRELLL